MVRGMLALRPCCWKDGFEYVHLPWLLLFLLECLAEVEGPCEEMYEPRPPCQERWNARAS